MHAPQFSFRGLGMDLELLDWLNTYTFPEEAKYEDLSYAETAYESFVTRLTRSTTTRACIFATLHLPATLLLMQKLEDAGLDTYVGKVNMNRNCPAYLREISTNQAIRDTESWVLAVARALYAHEADFNAALYSVLYRRFNVCPFPPARKIRPSRAEPPV